MALDDLARLQPTIALAAFGENFGALDSKRVQENYIAGRKAFRELIGIGVKVDSEKIKGETVTLDKKKVKDWMEKSAPQKKVRKKKRNRK